MIHDLHFQSDGALRPTGTLDHFEFFGLPRTLNLDVSQLEADYFALSRRFHPDFYVMHGAEQQMLALEKTSALNNAYRVLKQPVSRAEYLVELETGVVFGESGEARQVPMELLEDVMDVRERLMDLQMADDEERVALCEALQKDRAWSEERLREADSQIDALADRWSAISKEAEIAASRAELVGELKDVLSQRRYFSGLLREIDKAVS